MNYPIWELHGVGGGTLIALIAVLHVYVSHLAVGGGIFIWLTDRKATKTGDAQLLDYVRSHTWFFLLLTMVFGGITGVGIWFIIALVHPAATSTLIHAFVFGWAIEWVFFVGEIVALLIYHYYFETLGTKTRITIAFFYALFAWLSLVVINAILSFMLTPGAWLESRSFWDGILNPTYIPSTIFRTFIATMFAGLFGYITAVFRQDSEFRNRVIRYCSRWLLVSAVGVLFSGWWYYYAVPESVRIVALDINPDIRVFVTVFSVASVALIVLGTFLMLRLPLAVQRVVVACLVVVGLAWIGGFEYAREIARKPFVIMNYMYSNSILSSDKEMLDSGGVLPHAKWVSVHEVTPENHLSAGKELFNLQCLSCHTAGGLRNDITARVQGYPELGIRSLIEGVGRVSDYMPPFCGTAHEKDALAGYIAGNLAGTSIDDTVKECSITPTDAVIPPFDAATSEYVLLAWNDLGMHCVSDCDKWFTILPPANTIEAQLIRRGELPALVDTGVTITYAIETQHQHPEGHSDFWKYSESTFGKAIAPPLGLAGTGVIGEMAYDGEKGVYAARLVPVVPYRDDGGYNPYPLFTLEAREKSTGALLATTTAVAPAATEMGCRNCHGGTWRFADRTGVSDETAQAILEAHDRINGTTLLAEARAGKPKLCQSCHADPALASAGLEGVLTFSSAMHGWHANYMPKLGADACMMCHPSSPNGATRCQRGVHTVAGVTCVDCHGSIADHALSLLMAEREKPQAQRLMKNLVPTLVQSLDQVQPRSPWINEPDCLTCHADFEPPKAGYSSFNVWASGMDELYRMRTDNTGIRCQACHGSTHAEYPTSNPYGRHLSNTQPMQYMGTPYPIGEDQACAICHKQTMESPVHHELMDRAARLRVSE